MHKDDINSELFSKSICPSEEMFFLYLEDKLSSKERHHFEKHLLSCELCSDALEGFSLMEGKDALDTAIGDVHHKIDKMLVNKNSEFFVFQFRNIAAALASVAVLGIAWYFAYNTFFENSEMAQESGAVEKKEVAAAPQSDTVIALEVDSGMNSNNIENNLSLNYTQEPVQKELKNQVTVSSDALVEQENVKTGSYTSENVLTESKVAGNVFKNDNSENNQLALEEKKSLDDEVLKPSKDIIQYTAPVDRKQSIAKSKSKSDDENLRSKKGQGVYTEQMPKGESLDRSFGVSTDTLNTLMQKQIGVEAYQKKNYLLASTYLEDYLKQNPSDDEVKWYLALSYLEVDKKDQAIVLLQQLKSDNKSNYQTAATEKLNTMKK